MRTTLLVYFIFLFSFVSHAQVAAKQIYETERAFEKMVAEKGMREGFIEFLSPVGIMFMPDVVNGRETWKARPASPAALTWNPIWIDVSSNGVLAYSVGNSMYRPNGKDDTSIFYGHYISIWTRQGNGEYRAALDTGINHDKPAVIPTEWKSPAAAKEKTEGKMSAGDHSTGFFSSVQSQGNAAAYGSYLADDAIMMRDGKQPFFGRKAAIEYLKKAKSNIVFARRKSFIEAGDLAYVNSTYKLLDKAGAETEQGNFVQVWKLTGGKWKIVADVFVPLPKPSKTH
jgi:ketosteroid isomerase-like protein